MQVTIPLTPDELKAMFIALYQADTVEGRAFLEERVRHHLQSECGTMDAEQYAAAQAEVEELIQNARASVRGVQLHA